MMGSSLENGIGRPKAQWRSMEDLGAHPARMAITSEDGHFFVHSGFDWDGICSALAHNEKGGSVRGGSTISQQTARNLFLWQRRSWLRKGLEAYYTIWLELLVPKERILEIYLNIAETGPLVFGYEAAAQHWYSRPASALNADQAARITALLPNPSERQPDGKLARKKARRLTRYPAPMPGDPGLEILQKAWDDRAWWPICP